MRYVVDSLELPQGIKHYYYLKWRYNFSYVCKNCGTELIWDFPYLMRKSDYPTPESELEQVRRIHKMRYTAQERYEAACRNLICPICGAQLQKEKGYYMPGNCGFKGCEEESLGYQWYSSYNSEWQNISDSEQFTLMEQVRKSVDQECAISEADAFSSNCNQYVAINASVPSADIQQNGESLKNYILNLIHLENNIFSLKQNLADLYYRRLINDRLVVFSAHSPAYEAKKELDALRTAYNEALKAVDETKSSPLPVISVNYPSKPAIPIYGAPGLFNKKKVLAENEELSRKYEATLDAYRKEVQNCDNEKARLTAEAQAKHDAAVREAQENADVAKSILDRAEIDANDRINAAKTYPVPAMAIKMLLDREIADTEDLLKKIFAARNELYAYDIVFGKYRDAVALSSFYEYLMSGRCTSLAGADGAYNIYENEIRMNRVISQLDTVISSLEEIKQNQYVMYQEMCSINASLQSLNTTMDKALTSIQGIEANTTSMNRYMEHLSQNSDVIAHNTAVTAYYSKVNAELTNALGYMVAFK